MISLLKYIYDSFKLSNNFQYRQEVLKKKFQKTYDKKDYIFQSHGERENIDCIYDETRSDIKDKRLASFDKTATSIEKEYDDFIERNKAQKTNNQARNPKDNVTKETNNDKEKAKSIEQRIRCFEDVGIVTQLKHDEGVINKTIPFKKSAAFKLFRKLKVGCRVSYLAYLPNVGETDTDIKLVKIKEIMESPWDLNDNEQQIEQEALNQIENGQSMRKYFKSHERKLNGVVVSKFEDQCLSIEIEEDWFTVDAEKCLMGIELEVGDKVVAVCEVQTDYTYFNQCGSILQVHSVNPLRIFKNQQLRLVDFYGNEEDPSNSYGELTDKTYFKANILAEKDARSVQLRKNESVLVDSIECQTNKFCKRAIQMKFIESLNEDLANDKENKACHNPYLFLSLQDDCLYTFHGLDHKEIIEIKFKNLDDRTIYCDDIVIRKPLPLHQQHSNNHYNIRTFENQIVLPKAQYKRFFVKAEGGEYILKLKIVTKHLGLFQETIIFKFRHLQIERKIRIQVDNGSKNDSSNVLIRSEDWVQSNSNDNNPCNEECDSSFAKADQTNKVLKENPFEKLIAPRTNSQANEYNDFDWCKNDSHQPYSSFSNIGKKSYFSQMGKLNESRQQRFKANSVWVRKQDITPGIRVTQPRRFVAHSIDTYVVPTLLRRAYLTMESVEEIFCKIEEFYPCLRNELSIKNYVNFFQTYIFLEELETFVQFRKYDRDRAHFQRENEYLVLMVEDLAERRPSPIVGDLVRAFNPFETACSSTVNGASNFKQKCFDGIIHKIFNNRVCLKFDPNFHSSYNGEDYRIEFHFSRFSYRKEHHAVEKMMRNFPENFLFPKQLTFNPQKVNLDATLDENGNLFIDNQPVPWNNPVLNHKQKQAVCNILRSELVNLPYVIFGPPGTGKTVTVVETILQITKHVSDARLLVCSPSNSSANLIATKLIEVGKLKPGDFVRVASFNSVEKEQIPLHLCPFSATIDTGIEGSCESIMRTTNSGLKLNCQMKYFGNHPITISTCSTMGVFHLLKFPPNHFTHVIVDEAAQCSEPEVMIPISLLTANSNGQVILAGDPKQLEAITTNIYSIKKGPPTSFLTRLITTSPLYGKDLNKFLQYNGYNPSLVTKLVYNYRALPSVLKIYNELYYDSDLIPCIDPLISREAELLALCKSVLPATNKTSGNTSSEGVYFYGLVSENMQMPDSPSWYNPLEAKHVFLIVIKLYNLGIKPDQMGIITPYSKQVKHFRLLFENAEIVAPKIGSVEEFQSQERDIIFISTVRSQSLHLQKDLRHLLGFIRNPKRTNVAISRARCLNYIVGNPYILQKDTQWYRVIQQCIISGTYAGCPM